MAASAEDKRRRPSPGRPPIQALDEAILRATLELIGEVGYEGLSIEAVARRAGTTKPSLYRRWPGKDALVLAALRSYVVTALGDRKPAGTGRLTGLRAELLARARTLATEMTPHHLAVFAGVLLAIRSNQELAALVRQALVQTESSAMAAILARATARGEIPTAQVAPPALHVLPAVLFLRLLVLGQPADEAFLTQLVDEVLMPLFTKGRPAAPRGTRGDSPRR